ncbi:carbohydrate-binding module family 20 domain-containing protein [Dactylosporangium sp. AC04546]|uniref:carbohydrate-binding module family 20 domain-containing protein n=1 Tax=Dactylosporangium sp. AC04546 TaxID=2862460 RepID=UPI001EDFDFAC|nr:carbohydrate-binding module family 20 domain-containing protein [Dactylosporangium sp. AC04546]WVK89275.1 carbohydrate-binding module family 20 domain-containing protein [Dactylosporangium sp. AC04546]
MRRPRLLRTLAIVGGLVLAAALAVPLLSSDRKAEAAVGDNDVIANLWLWPWNSIASECTNVLGPAGYGAVQVAPPEDSISVAGHPWWDIYQPASYQINGRMGTRAQFQSMVNACHAAGVKVYVDAVINHMTGANQSSTTAYGGSSFTNNYSYPTAGYSSSDFHFYPGNCPQSDNQIHDWNNQTEVWNCQLVGLSDLKTESDYVRTKIAGYLNDLIGVGVDGFRVDAAKHMSQADLAAIKGKLSNQSVYWSQEVIPGSPGNLTPAAYEGIGGVLEFTYAYSLKSQFQGSIANLQTFGPSWGLRPSDKSTVFVSNHDTERNGQTLSYKNGSTDTLATVFMLAWNHGTPNVMSSFTFSNNDASPPADGNGYVTAVSCGSGWECQHRQRAVKNMVGFHNATRANTTVGNWWSDGSNAIAFSRGSSGWVAVNNGSGTVAARTFTTGLPAGVYCDVIHGDYNASAQTCSGPTVTVDGSGQATVGVAAKDAVAIHANARVTGNPTTSPSPSQSTGQGVSFTVTGAPTGDPIYLVGSVAALGSWNTANAVPMTANGSAWTTTVSLPAGALEYKFIQKSASGTVTWEPGSNHTYTVPASGTGTINTTWNGSSTTNPAVTFNATVTTTWGQNVFVVGSVPALGSWNTANAIALSSANYPVWSATVTLPANTTVEYKFIKKNSDGSVTWESGANRTLATGTASQTVNATWK